MREEGRRADETIGGTSALFNLPVTFGHFSPSVLEEGTKSLLVSGVRAHLYLQIDDDPDSQTACRLMQVISSLGTA